MTKSELIAELRSEPASAKPRRRADRGDEFSMRSPWRWPAANGWNCGGFGAFTVKKRDARTGRNPRTGEAVPLDEKAVPFFKAGKELRERVNRGKSA